MTRRRRRLAELATLIAAGAVVIPFTLALCSVVVSLHIATDEWNRFWSPTPRPKNSRPP